MPEPNVRYVAVFAAGADSAVALVATATPAAATSATSAIAIRFMRSQGSRALTPELRCLPRFYGCQTRGAWHVWHKNWQARDRAAGTRTGAPCHSACCTRLRLERGRSATFRDRCRANRQVPVLDGRPGARRGSRGATEARTGREGRDTPE